MIKNVIEFNTGIVFNTVIRFNTVMLGDSECPSVRVSDGHGTISLNTIGICGNK